MYISVTNQLHPLGPYQVDVLLQETDRLLIFHSCGWKWKSCALCISPRAGLVEYKRHGELECYMADCARKKRTLPGGREEAREGGVKQHVWRATPVLFRTWLCVHVFSVSYCAYFRVLYMFNLLARLRAPASLEGGIIIKRNIWQCLGIYIKRLTVALTVPSFVCLFVCIVRSLRVVC